MDFTKIKTYYYADFGCGDAGDLIPWGDVKLTPEQSKIFRQSVMEEIEPI